VAHVCYPSYSGGRDRKIMVQSQPGRIVSEVLSQHINRCNGTYLSPQLWGRHR
jgi:hypothetical protein